MLCPDCGSENQADAKFCKSCGRKLGGAAPAQPDAPANVIQPPVGNDGLPAGEDLDGQPGGERVIWTGRPRIPLSWWSALTTRYKLTNERLIVMTGFISKRSEEIELYRVNDVEFKQSIMERMFGLGDVTLISTDTSSNSPKMKINDIREPERVKDLVRTASRAERQRRRVLLRDEV